MTDIMTTFPGLTRILAAGLVVALSGCFSLGRDEPAMEYYVLNAGESEVRTQAPEGAPAIGLRQVRLAEYLDVPFIVVRRGPNRITYSDFHRWGEGLSGGINRAVARHLEARGAFGGVDVAPWSAGAGHDYLIQIHVTRFEGVAADVESPESGSIHISASWNAVRMPGSVVVARGHIDRRHPDWQVGDYSGLLEAFELGLSELGDDILEGLASANAVD
jgi:uncharacterized lipoprotein YmbA